MVPVGVVPTVITELFDAGPLQVPLKIVTVYVPASVAEYVVFTAPLISIPSLYHWYDVPPVAVNNCEPPEQIDALAGFIVPVGVVPTVITELFDAGPLQLPLKIITVYVPASVAEYVVFTAPLISIPSLYHWYDVPPVAVNI